MTESAHPDQLAVAPAEVASGQLPGVGNRLRQTREMRSLSVSDVALSLKLGTNQIEALENGNWEVLPGQTFIRGFVRNYARVLQIDPAPLMEQLDSQLEKPVDTLNVPEPRRAAMPSGQPRRDRTFVFAGLALLVLAALAYFLLPNDLSALRQSAQGLIDSVSRKEPVPAPAASAPAAPAASSEPIFPPGSTQQQVMNPQAQAPAEMAPAQLAAPGASAATGADGDQLRFVFSGESWVEVRDRDNKVILSQRSPAGAEQAVNGRGPLTLVIGYAPGVKLFWRGQAVDLAPHTKGEVARLVLE